MRTAFAAVSGLVLDGGSRKSILRTVHEYGRNIERSFAISQELRARYLRVMSFRPLPQLPWDGYSIKFIPTLHNIDAPRIYLWGADLEVAYNLIFKISMKMITK